MEQLLFPALLFLAMWFLLIRPQQARVRRQRQLTASLAVGDEVLTAGGIIGVIRVLTDEEARVEVGPGVEVRVLRGAISQVVAKADEPHPEANGSAEPGSPEAA
jgi:preprotein translocase subunit YajC